MSAPGADEKMMVVDEEIVSTSKLRGFGGILRVTVPAGAAVNVRAVSPAAVSDDPDTPVSRGMARSLSLRKRIVSFVFDRTRKHGRFIGGNRGARRVVERATV